MNKGLKVIAIVAGIISMIAFLALGCVYAKKIVIYLRDIKDAFFLKICDSSKKYIKQK